MRAWISALMLTWSILAVPSAFAGPPGVKLVVSPPNLVFRVNSPLIAGATAVAELHVQVNAPPRQPWRLTVMALGPVMSAEGGSDCARPDQVAGQSWSRCSWTASSAPAAPSSAVGAKAPRPGCCTSSVQPGQETFAGNYNQKLLFSLSSP